MTDPVYIMLTYATYVALAVIASTLLFSLVVLVVAVQEALKVVCKSVSGIAPVGGRVAETRPALFNTPPTGEATGSCASTVRSRPVFGPFGPNELVHHRCLIAEVSERMRRGSEGRSSSSVA